MYQNIGFAAGRSAFVKVNPTGTNDELVFTAKTSSVPVVGGKVSMVSSSITLNVPKDVTLDPASTIKSYVNNSVKLSYGIVKGDAAAYASLETRVLQLLAVARADFNLDNGLVPTGTAAFTS